jgi:hypothetical protein
MRSANAASSSRSTSQPVTPSTMTSSTADASPRPVARSPRLDQASGVLLSEVTTMSAAACHAGIASLQPANRGVVQPERRRLRLEPGRSGPSPTMHSRVIGDRACTGEHLQQAVDPLDVRVPPGGDYDDVRVVEAIRPGLRPAVAHEPLELEAGGIRGPSRASIFRSASRAAARR